MNEGWLEEREKGVRQEGQLRWDSPASPSAWWAQVEGNGGGSVLRGVKQACGFLRKGAGQWEGAG